MILDVIGRARRRLLWNAMAAEGARAICVGLGLLILLLLLGTDILGWQFLLFGPAATLLAGTYLTRRRLPDARAAAQILDRRLGLLDTISTALFFWPTNPPRQYDEGMRRAQREYALRIAAGIDVRQALPLELPRAAYAGVVLALLAGGLFGLRYGVQGRLDLKPPAAPAVAHLIEGMKSQLAALEQMLKQLDPTGPRNEKGTEQAKLSEKNDSDPNSNSGTPTETSNGEDQLVKKQDSTMASDEPGSQEGQQGQDQAANAQNSSRQGNNNGQNGQPRQQDQRSPGSDSSASNSDSDSSLLNKARDTMANLLSAVRPQPGGNGGSRMDMDRNARPQNGKSNGKAGTEERKQDSAASPSQGEPQGSESQAQQGAGSQVAGQPQGADSDKQPGTGAGRDEGDKQIKLAEQLAAMGKISMILGKRSQDVTGASSVEVVSGEQELKTRYENRKVKHNEVRAKAEQDQVPVELQEYVSRYFQEVRGTASAGRSTRPSASTGSASRSTDASAIQKQK